MGLIDEIGAGPVALDSAIFIYWIEEDPRYVELVAPVFEAIDGGSLEAVTSELTLLEVLVAPFRSSDPELARRYQTILIGCPGLTLVPLDRRLLRTAAGIRAVAGVKTPDALQLAAASAAGCTALLTNDRRLPRRLGRLRVVQLAGPRPADF